MLILGIDPGYAIVGFGLVESAQGRYRLTACGAINTPAGVRLSARLWRIAADLEELISRFHPDVMAIEELFFNHNVTTGIGVAQARGVILMTAEKLGLPICEYNPSQVKQAVVGYGKAAGDGHDQAAVEPERRPQAGRRRRRGGHRPVPRPVVHLAAQNVTLNLERSPCFTM